MKNILKITFVIIGTLIGAGFASGQEMYIFFFSYGLNGIFGLIVSSTLMGIIIYNVLNIIKKYNISNYKEFMNVIINKTFKKKYLNIKNIFGIIINIFILITFFIMIAGFGAYFEQSLGINHFIGSIVLAILCFIVFLSNVKGLIKVNELLIPILIGLICLVGILNLFNLNINEFSNNLINKNKSGWLINAILYCSYNSILLIPSIITLHEYITNKNKNIIITIITTIIVLALSITLFSILSNIDSDISNIEMPVVYVIEKLFTGLKTIYGFVIISSIFTTSISLGTSFLNNVCDSPKRFPQVAGIMCITSVIVSNFGFSNLVNLLYPIFGYLGIIQIFYIFKICIEKN